MIPLLLIKITIEKENLSNIYVIEDGFEVNHKCKCLRVLTVPARVYLSSINQISWNFIRDLLNEDKFVINLIYFEL